MSISLCMIVKNEEASLPINLTQASQFVDEIIIVDTGSTDNTIKIAEEFGAKVIISEWVNDFAFSRNQAIELATKDWILILDADEEIKADDGIKIKQFLQSDEIQKTDAFILTVCNFIEPNNAVSAEKNKSIRLFKNKKNIKYEGRVHEQVINYTYVNEIPIQIYHHGYLAEIIKKKNKHQRNKDLLINSINEDPENNYYRYHLAINYYSNKDYKESEEILTNLIPRFTGKEAYAPRAYKCLIMAYKQQDKFDDMILTADIAINKWPDYTDLYYMKSLAFYNTGKYGQSLNMLKKCLELGEATNYDSHSGVGSSKALLMKSNIEWELGNKYEAIDSITELVKQVPNSPSLFVRYLELILNVNKPKIANKLLLNYCDKFSKYTNEVVVELFNKQLFEQIVLAVDHLQNISIEAAVKYTLSCAFTKRYKVAIKNIISIFPKLNEDDKSLLGRHLGYCLYLDNKTLMSSSQLAKFISSDDIFAYKYFFDTVTKKNRNGKISSKYKDVVAKILKDVEFYGNQEINSILLNIVNSCGLNLSDLVVIYDERKFPIELLPIYLEDYNLSGVNKYKRFISISKYYLRNSYTVIINEGESLIEDGAKLINVYSYLAQAYEYKAIMIRRNNYE